MENMAILGSLPQISVDMPVQASSRFENRIRAAQGLSGDKRNDELKNASKEFESLFVAYLLKVMRETIEESGLTEGGFGKTIYTELFDQEISRSIARQGALGISDLLYENLSTSKRAEGHEGSSQSPGGDSISPTKAPSPATPRGEGASKDLEPDRDGFQLPIRAPISSGFGLRIDPFSRRARFHKGVDLSAPEGTDVLAALKGTVVYAGYDKGYGNSVLIQHSGGLQTRYAHLASITVKEGDAVSAQALLGTVGSTGHSTGPHLHFEVIRMGEQIDPFSADSPQPAAAKMRAAQKI